MASLESESPSEGPFHAEDVYNPVYEERRLEIERASEKLPGEWFRMEKTGTIVGCNREDGLFLKTIASNKQLEEDLTALCCEGEKLETFLTKEELREATNKGLASILRDYGKFFGLDEVQKVFPGVALDDIESYDFNRSRVKIFVLGPRDFNLFVEHYGADDSSERKHMARIAGTNFWIWEKDQESKYHMNPRLQLPFNITTIATDDETDIIVIRENDGNYDRKARIAESTPGSKEAFGRRIELVKRTVVERVRHEVLHTFRAGFDFDNEIMEGITSYYTKYSGENPDPIEGAFGLEAYRDLYPGPALVSDVIKVCIKMGVSEEDVHRAFLASDHIALNRVKSVLQRTMGGKFANDFMMYGFGSMWEAEDKVYKYLQKLNNPKNLPKS